MSAAFQSAVLARPRLGTAAPRPLADLNASSARRVVGEHGAAVQVQADDRDRGGTVAACADNSARPGAKSAATACDCGENGAGIALGLSTGQDPNYISCDFAYRPVTEPMRREKRPCGTLVRQPGSPPVRGGGGCEIRTREGLHPTRFPKLAGVHSSLKERGRVKGSVSWGYGFMAALRGVRD